MEVIEWKFPESHDGTFGKPWFEAYNPQVNWQTQEICLREYSSQTSLGYGKYFYPIHSFICTSVSGTTTGWNIFNTRSQLGGDAEKESAAK
ncbi:hypothetical protein PPTG_20856 [Phytophthora nicotianae INRA-310]|uniref:Uncharacterized protein n=1 Tax=Phytophthora nicotianae (strain INRA-310) TaxID=761204 RepID=W2RK39_PHYN3|nr:hypothetical protein PPTG_20856 [Phytophthora nicotianae INRA-310]ETN24999.1 hypothetical protein PPTG_20856 [Phytophthora nicotianae INRA-310]